MRQQHSLDFQRIALFAVNMHEHIVEAVPITEGARSRTIEDITGSVQQLQRRLAGDDKSAVAALERVGLSIYNLEQMNPDQAFIASVRSLDDAARARELRRARILNWTH